MLQYRTACHHPIPFLCQEQPSLPTSGPQQLSLMWPFPADRQPPVLSSLLHQSSGGPTSTLPTPSSSSSLTLAGEVHTHCHPPTAPQVPAGQPALALGSSPPLLETGVCLCASSLPTPAAQEVPHTHCSQRRMASLSEHLHLGERLITAPTHSTALG